MFLRGSKKRRSNRSVSVLPVSEWFQQLTKLILERVPLVYPTPNTLIPISSPFSCNDRLEVNLEIIHHKRRRVPSETLSHLHLAFVSRDGCSRQRKNRLADAPHFYWHKLRSTFDQKARASSHILCFLSHPGRPRCSRRGQTTSSLLLLLLLLLHLSRLGCGTSDLNVIINFIIINFEQQFNLLPPQKKTQQNKKSKITVMPIWSREAGFRRRPAAV